MQCFFLSRVSLCKAFPKEQEILKIRKTSDKSLRLGAQDRFITLKHHGTPQSMEEPRWCKTITLKTTYYQRVLCGLNTQDL